MLERAVRIRQSLPAESLCGMESGGAVADMARYCAYLDSEGRPLPWLQPLDSLSGNGRHAVVIAGELVRIDMLRVGRTYPRVRAPPIERTSFPRGAIWRFVNRIGVPWRLF